MKEVLWLALVLLIASLMITGCPARPAVEEPVQEVPEEVVEAGMFRLGLGVVSSIARSRDAGDGVTAQAQADVVLAAVLFDHEDRVVSVSIDSAQNRVAFDEEMQLVTDTKLPGTTKFALGDDYGMRGASAIGKEWYEQVEALTGWMVGKTVDEVLGLPVKVVDGSHLPDVPELTATVTISVQDFLAAVENAYNNSIEVENAATAGLGTDISLAGSRGLDTDNNILPMAQFDNTVTAVAFDANDLIVGAIIDVAQIGVNFDADGVVTSDRAEVLKTKVQLGDDYGMRAASAIGKEWYEQVEALADWMVGKTVDEVLGLPVKVVDGDNVPDVPELVASVTIAVESYQVAVADAFENAR